MDYSITRTPEGWWRVIRQGNITLWTFSQRKDAETTAMTCARNVGDKVWLEESTGRTLLWENVVDTE